MNQASEQDDLDREFGPEKLYPVCDSCPDAGEEVCSPQCPKCEPDALERTEELFAFLQGIMSATIYITDKDSIPKLTADQAWTVIWYLGEGHWQVTDYIERCDVCGKLFDSNKSG